MSTALQDRDDGMQNLQEIDERKGTGRRWDLIVHWHGIDGIVRGVELDFGYTRFVLFMFIGIW